MTENADTDSEGLAAAAQKAARKTPHAKIQWGQTGMPAALVRSLSPRSALSEFRSVLNEARSQVLTTVDVEAMAQELVASGGREFVEMVRDLTTELARAKKELESAERRHERLLAELARRGIRIGDDRPQPEPPVAAPPSPAAVSAEAGRAKWEAWNRRFQSLLSADAPSKE